CPIDRYYLEPGEKVVIDSYDLGIARDDKQAKQLKHPVGYRFRCEGGVYYARFGLRFGNVGSSLLPVEDADFKGRLESGPRKFTVAAASDDPNAKAVPAKSTTPAVKPGEQVKGEKPALVWGEAVGGLRAAVEFVTEKGSYAMGEGVEVRLHIKNVSDENVEFSSLSTRQDYAIVKDGEGKEVKVEKRWHTGTVSRRRHTLKPGQVLVEKTSGLSFEDFHDSALLGRRKGPWIGSVVRCTPGRYSICYAVNQVLRTGERTVTVTVTERPPVDPRTFELVLDGQSTVEALNELMRKYRLRVCFEQVGPEALARERPLTGSFSGATVAGLLDSLTASGPYKWEKFFRTYVVYPREGSVLRFFVKTDIRDRPLEEVARAILDQDAGGRDIEIESPYKGDMNKHLWISKHYAMYALSSATEGVLHGDAVWSLTLNQGRRVLSLHKLGRAGQRDARAPDEEARFPWGTAIQGVRCRLGPMRSAWRTDDVPTLSLDIRNQGKESIDFLRIAEAHCEIEIDGRWYGIAEPPNINVPGWALEPGTELNDAIEIRLTDSWALPKEGADPAHAPGIGETWGQRLQLAPGKHSVRVRFRPTDWLEGYVKNEANLCATSNYVEVEFLDAGEEDALWGEAVDGLRIRLSSRANWQLGETPIFRMDIRNHSENEYRLVLAPSSWELNVDGKTYRQSTFHYGEPPMLMIGPRQEHKGVIIPLDEEYGWQSGDTPLAFVPGKHRVSVTARVNPMIDARRTIRLASKPIGIRVSQNRITPPAWSRHTEGFQLRAWAAKRKWEANETPSLRADVRNLGPHSTLISVIYHNAWEVEVEGKWYYCSIRNTLLPHPLTPYSQHDNIAIDLARSYRGKPLWVGKADEAPLNLSGGLHKIRVALPFGCKMIEGQDENLRLVSEPFEIEIAGGESDKLVWGEAVGGLRAAVEFVPEKESYAPGDRVEVRLHIKNVSDKNVEF
ncbi:MAG: hypothetical protein JSU94_02555, partial [Phycisphaerales bacterium]